jgi:hypothetical protein
MTSKPGALALALLLGAQTACGDLTSVDAPDLVQPGDLANPQGAAARYVGAKVLFARAYNGNDINISLSGVVATGLLTDEMGDVSGVVQTLDERAELNDGSPLGYFGGLAQARLNLFAARFALGQFAPDPPSRIGEVLALAGFTEVLFAEHFCSGVPLVQISDGLPVAYGEPLTGAEMFQQAIQEFDSATVYAPGDPDIAALAQVGRARALLGLGQFAEAGAAVAGVPTAFEYDVEHAGVSDPNQAYAGFTGPIVTLSDSEGGNGLNFRSAGDPRLPVVPTGTSRTGESTFGPATLVAQGVGAPTPLASGIEARLIQAETALQAGDTVQWLAEVNEARATRADLPAFTTYPGGQDAKVDLLFRERAFWLYGTGHRLGDLRRLVRQYGRPGTSVFPTGAYASGQTYGEAYTLSLSDLDEGRNPNYRGCLDRNP